jgi:hypothetical protein
VKQRPKACEEKEQGQRLASLQTKLGLLQMQDKLEKKKVGECLVATFLERKGRGQEGGKKRRRQPEGA